MNPVVDTVMIILFVLLMIFIIRGYHQSKYDERFQDNDNASAPDDQGKGN